MELHNRDINHLCSSTTATIALQLELKVVVVVGANNVNAAEPAIQHAKTPNVFLVLDISSRVVVVVWANFVIAADPEIQHAYTTNDHLVLEIIDEVFSSHRPHSVPNRIVSTTRSEKSTTTRHRDANTPAAQVCRRRARDHDSCSGSDGPTIQRDCERHHIELRNWSCEHENPSVLPARDWVCQIHTHKTGMSTTLSMNWTWGTSKFSYDMNSKILLVQAMMPSIWASARVDDERTRKGTLPLSTSSAATRKSVLPPLLPLPPFPSGGRGRVPSSILGIHPGADLFHRLLHHPPPLLLPLLLLLGKRLLEEEADCAAVDTIVITRETMARQRRHSGSHVTDRDCPHLHPPAPRARRGATQLSWPSSVPVGLRTRLGLPSSSP